MTIWEAIVLGIIQGATEFLPVSSSGHLVIAQQLFGITEHVLTFDVMVHAGSLLAIVVALRDDLVAMANGLLSLFGRGGGRTRGLSSTGSTGAGRARARAAANDSGGADEAAAARRLLWQVAVATVPLVIAALLFRDVIDDLFSSALVPVLLLFVTGAFLLYADRASAVGAAGEPGWSHALWMGMAQAFAVLPGLSRSGVTMSAGMMSGLSREAAAKFSFLLAIPAILGATVLELRGLLAGESASAAGTGALIVGTIVSGITSYLAIRLFLRFVRRGRLAPFAYYTWFLGAIMLWVTRAG